MQEIISISGFVILIAAIVSGGLLIGNRRKRLEQTYHDALHAESIGNYTGATQLYQSILDNAGASFLTDETIKSSIKRRMDTIRYQQDFLSRFASGPKMA